MTSSGRRCALAIAGLALVASQAEGAARRGAADRARAARARAAAPAPAPPPDLAAPTGGARPAQPLFPPVELVQLGVEQGLPQIHVTAVTQDRRGFLWIGTQAGGLARYDGARMVRYEAKRADPSTLSSQFVTDLEPDPSGALWVGTGDAGLNLYDPATDRFTRFGHDEGNESSIAFDAVTVLTASEDGTLWIGLGNGGVDRFDPKTRTFHRVVEASKDAAEVTAIATRVNDGLLVATLGAGLMEVSQARTQPRASAFRFNDALPARLTALLVDQAGTFWIGTESGGLFSVAAGGAAPVAHVPRPGDRTSLSSPQITSLFEDRDGKLWVGTQDGLNELDRKRGVVTRFAQDPQFPVRTATFLKYVTTAFQDRAGVLWFGSLDFGLYKLDPLRRRLHNHESSGDLGIPIAFCETPDGALWAGTYGHGLYRLELDRQRFVAYPSLGTPGGDDEVVLTSWLTALHCGADGKIWIGGSGLGLVMFDPRSGRHVHYPADPDGETGPAADRIEHIVAGPDGALWLATWGGGVGRHDPRTGAFKIVGATDEGILLPSDNVHRLHFDEGDPDALWVGAAQGGATRIDLKAGTTQSLRGATATTGGGKAGALPSDNVMTFHQDPGGTMWMGTDGGGLVRRDAKTGAIAAFGKAEGLASEVIYGILPADDGKLWLTSTDGLIAFDPKTRAAVTFTQADGLNSSEFTQNGYFRSRRGELFVTGLHGFNHFDPKEVAADPYVPPVVLTGFRLFGRPQALERPIWDTSEIDLSFRDAVVTIDFAALSFAAPERTRYAYRLEGIHEDWVTTDRGEVTYTNLDGGDYVLRIKAGNRHGVWSEAAVALALHVDPPPWASWWAYTIYGLLAIGAVALFLRFQAAKVETLKQAHRLSLAERELELTGAVQAGFLPPASGFASGPLRGFGFYRPATSCSGDWWWHEQSSPEVVTLIVGDVTGHGAGSAMVTAAVATAFRVQARVASRDVGARLRVLHDEVVSVASGKYFMTLTALELEPATGRYRLHSASGLPLISMSTSGEVKIVSCPGNPLGGATFLTGTLEGTLAPGERLFLLTDGLPEIELAPGRQLGLKKLSALCQATRGMALDASIAQIIREAEKQQGARPQDDDWTLVVIEWAPPLRAAAPQAWT